MRAGLRDGSVPADADRLHDIADETNVVAPARFEAFADRRDLALDLTNLSTASPAPC